MCTFIQWLYEEEGHLINSIQSLVIKVMVVTLRMSSKSCLKPCMTAKLHVTYTLVMSAKDLSPVCFKIKIEARTTNEI